MRRYHPYAGIDNRDEKELFEDWAAGRGVASLPSPSDSYAKATSVMGRTYLVAAGCLLFVGTILVYNSDRTTGRAELQEAYDQGLMVWESRERPHFEQTQWLIRFNDTEVELSKNVTTGHSSSRLVTKHHSVAFQLQNFYQHILSPEELQKLTENDPSLPRNTSRGEPSQAYGRRGWAAGADAPNSINNTVEVALVARGVGEDDVLSIGSHQLIRSELRPTGNWKTCRHRLHGVVTTNKACLLVDLLHRICLRVKRDPLSSKWSLAGDIGTAGCGPHSSRSAVQYKSLRPPTASRGSTAVVPPRLLATSQINVHSDHDPQFLVPALIQIQGQPNVASTAGYIFLILGTVLVVPSLCLLLPSSLGNEVSESPDVEMATLR